MQIDVIDTWEGFCGLRPAWEAVHERDQESDYFLSWAWLAKVFEANPKRWRVLAVKPDDVNSDYVCFFPQKLKARWSDSGQKFKTEIEAAGKLSWAQYAGFVCLPDWDEQAITALASAVAEMPWARLSIKNFPCERRLNLFLGGFPKGDYRISHREYLINNGTVDNQICPQIQLPDDFETYLQSRLSSNTRQKMRRYWRKFKADTDLRITNSTNDTFDRDLGILLEMWSKSWTPSRGRKSAQRAVEKYWKILRQSASLNAVHIPVLWRGDMPLGALGNIVDRHKQHLYFIVAGRDEEVQDPNIGLLLHTHNIQWAIENGMHVYDFCHGNEPYKQSFGVTDRRVYNVTIARRSKSEVDQFDPYHVGTAMRKMVKLLEMDDAKTAANVCRQLLPLVSGE